MILSLEDDCLHRTACGAGGGTRSLQERVNPLSPDRRGYIFQSLFAPPVQSLSGGGSPAGAAVISGVSQLHPEPDRNPW